MSTNMLCCPCCGARLGPAVLPKPRRTTTSFQTCERRCEPCGVGFSNGDAPTTIYRDPLHNLPSEVRAGAMSTIRASVNVRNRTSKEARFGFSTAEDAVTWTVFSWLASENPLALIRFAERLGLQTTRAPSVFLWGAPLVRSDASDSDARLIAVLDALGEERASRTEPDVMLDYGNDGLVIIEVKHQAGNDTQPSRNAYKFERYVRGSDAFVDGAAITRSALYELARNWRAGHDLAGSRPFRLVNLGPPALFQRPAATALDAFEASLTVESDRAFCRLTWASLLSDLHATSGPLPTWLDGWLHSRGISA